MNTKTAVHFADNYLINATNPVTVNLIGAGGTGSNMLTALAKINHCLTVLGDPGLQVNVWDDDTVTEANRGRQLFAHAEVGLCKSVALVSRYNRFFGTNWKAIQQKFSNTMHCPNGEHETSIYISCVDNVPSRFEIASMLKNLGSDRDNNRNRPLYWMDFGNSRDTGQVILSTITEIRQPKSKLYRAVGKLSMITDEFKTLLENETGNNEPSCSLAEALEKQDLFINPSLVDMGGSLLWRMFQKGMTENRGFFHNLETLCTQPLKVA